MDIKIFKTLWGYQGPLIDAIDEAEQAGFNGIEGPAPITSAERQWFTRTLEKTGLSYIGEITTGGGYVPDRKLTVKEHLQSLDQQLRRFAELPALKINCIAGCDAWSEQQNISFFEQAMALGEKHGQQLCFETHRSRSLFNPWITRLLSDALPEMKFTADFSHWCVVCERLMVSEISVIEQIAPQIEHIHARVGYDQGPQVPHPAAPEYAAAVEAHQRWWEIIWQAQLDKENPVTTMTPEFGPDGYLHELPFSRAPVADLWQLNCWMADLEKAHFSQFVANTG